MPTLTAGNNITLNIGADDSVLVRARGAARVEAPSGTVVRDGFTGEVVFGPYNTGTVRLTAQVGDVFYEVIDGVGPTQPARWTQSGSRFDLLTPDGGVVALSEAVEHGDSLTATGTGYDGAGYFAGLNVTAYNGGPQTITVRDGVDDSGPIIRVYVVDGAGVYPFGAGMRLKIQTGVHLTISGGTSRTVLALVEPGPVVTGG